MFQEEHVYYENQLDVAFWDISDRAREWFLSRFSKASWRFRYKVIYDTTGIALLQALDYQIICLK